MQTTLPKAELHRHLDGSVRLSTILELAKQFSLPLPSFDEAKLAKHIHIQDHSSDLLAFLEKLDYGVSVLASVEACERIAFESAEDAFHEGLDYIELRFSPYYMAMKHQLNMADVVAAVIRGVGEARCQYKIHVELIGILSRSFGEEACMQELESLLVHHQDIVGLDLAGDEFNYPAARFQTHFALARRKTDWQFTVHAGEADGPNSVWDAINLLHATRIGHGVRAIEDPHLMDYLAKHEIGIETCLISNYQTGTWLDTPSHPLKAFLAHGIQASLSTDDPGVSNICLDDEFKAARTVLGLDGKACELLRQNAIKQAFVRPRV